MNTLKQILITAIFLPALSLRASDFRIGPKIGAGVGYPIGLKDGDAKAGVGFPIGAVAQFDFGNFGLDVGLNYRYSIFGTTDNKDMNGDGANDRTTVGLGYSSFELPVTAYYALRTEKGFFKFGGGLGLDYAVGKLRAGYDIDYSNTDPDTDESESISFSDLGFTQYDLYLIAHFGYEFVFEKWALSIDFQPKYGLVNRVKDKAKFNGGPNGVATPGGTDTWHTLWFDLSASFLF